MAYGDNDQIFEFDPRSILAALEQVNKQIQRVGKEGGDAAGKLSNAFQGLNDRLVKYNSRAEQSQERFIKSLEKQASLAGKSGVDRLIADRDRLTAKFSANAVAVDRITAAYKKLIDVERAHDRSTTGSGGLFHGSTGGAFAFRAVKDIFEGRTAYGEVEATRALGTLSGVPLVIGAATTAVVGFAAASAKAAVDVGNYAQKTHDLSTITGLTTTQIQQFQAAAKVTGDDISVLERMTRGLTMAIAEEGKQGDKARAVLSRMGVDIRGLRDGSVSSLELFQQVGDALEGQGKTWLRNRDAIDLFRRAGIQSLPMLVELNDSLRRTQGIEFFSKAQIEKFDEVHRQLAVISTEWEQFVLKVKAFVAEPITVILKGIQFSREDEFMIKYRQGARPGPLGQGINDEELDALIERGRDRRAALSARIYDARAFASFQGRLNPDERLQEAERQLSALSRPDRMSTTEQIQAYEAQQKVVEGRKEEARLWHEQKTRLEELAKAEREAAQGTELRLKADQKLIEFMSKEGVTPAMAQEMQRTLAPARLKEVTDILTKGRGLATSDLTKVATATGFAPQPAITAEQLSARIHQTQTAAIKDMQVTIKQENDDLREQIQLLDDILSTNRKIATQADESAAKRASTLAPSTAQNRIAFEARMRDIRISAANQEYDDEKKKIADQYGDKETRELAYQNLRLKNTQAIADAEQKFAEQVAQEQRKQLDEIKSKSESLYHTLFTNPSGFGKQLSTTVRDAALRPVESRLGEITAQLLYPIIGTAGPLGGGGALTSVRPYNGTVPVTIMNGGGGTGGGVGGGFIPSISAITGGVVGSGLPSLGSFSSLGGMIGGPGGTSGFAGPVTSLGGLFGRGSGTNFGGLFGGFGNLTGSGGLIFNRGSIPLGPGSATTAAGIGGPLGSLAGVASSQLGKVGLGLGGSMLLQHGLFGGSMGSASGLAQGTLGGAMLGFSIGGPLGAGIGALAGFGVGLGEMIAGVQPLWKHAQDLVRQQYHISINHSVADQIVAISQQKYGGMVSVAVRSPEVRQMLGLVAAGTGQAGAFSGQSSLMPHGASLVESGGGLFQQSTYQYGNPYAYQSNLPIYGGVSPTGYFPQPGGVNLSLNVEGDSVNKFLDGGVFSPSAVSAKSLSAYNSSSGRVDGALAFAQPGTIVG